MALRRRRFPEGSFLWFTFCGLVATTAVMLHTDLRDLLDQQSLAPFAMPTPVRMERPEKNDQIRPYLPTARPVAPDETGPSPGRTRPRDAREAEPMTFRFGAGGALYAEGTVTPGTAGLLEAVLAGERARGLKEIVLHSPGGSVTDAMAMARAIRKSGLATHVLEDGYCASSCPLLFAGGAERIAHPKAWIGVHQVYTLPSAMGSLAEGMDQAQRVSAEAQLLLVELGVDPRVWVHAMATPKTKLYLFTPDELTSYGLATELEPERVAGDPPHARPVAAVAETASAR
ncbi:ATP-dependent Clp protease proteolytic subunit [Faunimonas sp. B44]|uniref:ATP-dependent Clp protease proteolytic subunit n=1 Tax=Faunimonas sp. B44 TaxID=3461493 RepID=UPI004043C1A1